MARDPGERLPLADCRRFVRGNALSDAELIALRDQLYTLAGVICGAFPASVTRPLAAYSLDGDARVEADERATILEFDAGKPRLAAKRIPFGGKRNRRQ